LSQVPQDAAAREEFYVRALTDTGFFARHVLGMDTDRDENGNATCDIGKGGIRDHGPHQEMIRFFDMPQPARKVFWAPRYSYKSSAVMAFIERTVLANPNIAILLVMHSYEKAIERSAIIRNQLLTNPIIRAMWPNLKGPVWKKNAWTTRLRSDHTINEPQLTVASPQKPVTGGRFNLIIFDDIVDELKFRSQAVRQQAINCVETSLLLEARGTRCLLIGTPYHEADANHWVIDAGWDKCIHLDAGVEIFTNDDGKLDVTGEARWPNLPIEFLREKLRGGMRFETFTSQFLLKVVSGKTQPFQRHHFQPAKWDPYRHASLTGYLLTDVAPSGSVKGDFNVLCYIGVDERNHVYILDLELGSWQMHEFCQRYIRILQRWSAKVTHRCEVWEDSLNVHSYLQHLQIQFRGTGQRINAERQKRNNTGKTENEGPKDNRIAANALRFQALQVHVMDTIPRTWSNGITTRELWDPEGYKDQKGAILPSGDLVDWHLRFPNHPKKDVPDCLALMSAVDRVTSAPVCYWIRPSAKRLPESVMQRAVKRGGKKPKGGSASRFYERYAARGRSR